MSATTTRIHELVEANFSDLHNVQGVRFIDELLALASEVGEITCTLAGDRGLCFQIPDQPICEVELNRAKTILRLLCARLAVLCQESGCDFMVYGGEGIIRRTATDDLLDHENQPIRYSLAWKATWKNTTDKQQFTISLAR